MLKKIVLISLFSFFSFLSLAQTDTTQTRGTIKIGKPKAEKIYINASINYGMYDFSREGAYAPFPGVDGYTFPFNYNRYFNEKFKTTKIDLKEKASDTVRIEIKVLENGKVYLKDRSGYTMVSRIPTAFGEKVNGYKVTNLQVNSLNFLKEIKTWEPAYTSIPKKTKFKNQTVIKPDITYITATGILTIVFSTAPVEE